MALKLSPAAARRLAFLEDLLQKLQKLHGFVEQFATSRSSPELFLPPAQRGFAALKREFLASGMDQLAHTAAALELASGRTGSFANKRRVLREGVASLRLQLEAEQRIVLAEERARAAEAQKEDAP